MGEELRVLIFLSRNLGKLFNKLWVMLRLNTRSSDSLSSGLFTIYITFTPHFKIYVMLTEKILKGYKCTDV